MQRLWSQRIAGLVRHVFESLSLKPSIMSFASVDNISFMHAVSRQEEKLQKVIVAEDRFLGTAKTMCCASSLAEFNSTLNVCTSYFSVQVQGSVYRQDQEAGCWVQNAESKASREGASPQRARSCA